MAKRWQEPELNTYLGSVISQLRNTQGILRQVRRNIDSAARNNEDPDVLNGLGIDGMSVAGKLIAQAAAQLHATRATETRGLPYARIATLGSPSNFLVAFQDAANVSIGGDTSDRGYFKAKDTALDDLYEVWASMGIEMEWDFTSDLYTKAVPGQRVKILSNYHVNNKPGENDADNEPFNIRDQALEVEGLGVLADAGGVEPPNGNAPYTLVSTYEKYLVLTGRLRGEGRVNSVDDAGKDEMTRFEMRLIEDTADETQLKTAHIAFAYSDPSTKTASAAISGDIIAVVIDLSEFTHETYPTVEVTGENYGTVFPETTAPPGEVTTLDRSTNPFPMTSDKPVVTLSGSMELADVANFHILYREAHADTP